MITGLEFRLQQDPIKQLRKCSSFTDLVAQLCLSAKTFSLIILPFAIHHAKRVLILLVVLYRNLIPYSFLKPQGFFLYCPLNFLRLTLTQNLFLPSFLFPLRFTLFKGPHFVISFKTLCSVCVWVVVYFFFSL